MNNYDFVIDTEILDSLQEKVDTGKGNAEQAIKNIFTSIDNMNVNKFWEGEGYNSFSEAVLEKKSNLEDLSTSLDNYSTMLSNVRTNASTLIANVKKVCKHERIDE